MTTTNTWSVNADGDWGVAGDWSLTTEPNSGNAVVINTANIHTVTFSSGDSSVIYSLTVGQDYFSLTGGTLTVLTSASFALGLTQSGGSLGGGAYTLQATSVLSGGSATGSSTLTNQGTLALSNYLLGGNSQLLNSATTNQTAQITLGDVTGVGVLINNAAAGTYDIAGDFGVTEGAASASITNAGLFEKGYGGGVSTVSVSFTNTGTLTAKTGTLALAGPTNTISGSLTGAGEIAFSGGVTNLAASTTISVASLGLLGNAVLNLGGAETFTALQDSASSGQTTTLNINSYTLTLTGASSFQGAVDLVTGSGAFVNNGTLSLGGELLIGGTVAFTNKGTLTDVGSFMVGDGNGNSPTVTNASGATFNLANNGGIGFTGPAGNAFVNSGTLNKSGGGGTSVVAMNLTNSSTGTIGVASGVLDLTGAVNSISGTVSGAGALAFDGASVSTLAAQASLTLSVAAIDIYGGAKVSTNTQQYAGVFTESDSYGQTTTLNLLSGANFQLIAGSSAYFTGNPSSGQVVVNGAGTLTTAGSTTIGGSGMVFGGTNTWNNTGAIVETGQLTLGDSSGSAVVFKNNRGTFYLNGDVGIGLGVSTASTFSNTGVFAKQSGTGTSAIAVDFTNGGTVRSSSGLLDFDGPINSFNGTLSGTGAIGFDGASVSTLQSGVTLSVATVDISSAAELLLPASLTYSGVLNDDPGYAQSTNIVLQSSAVTLTLSGHDNFNANGGGSQAIVSGSGKLSTTGATSIGGAGMTLGGTVAWTNSGVVSATSLLTIGDSSGGIATLTNSGASAAYDLLGSAGIGHGSSTSSSFLNSASLVKSGDGSVSTISAEFNNTGTVTITNSTLDLMGVANSLAGTISGATGTLTLDGSSATTLQSGVTLSMGTLALDAAATLNLAANLSFAHTFNDSANYGVATTVNLNAHTLTLTGSVSLSSNSGGSEDVFTGGGSLVTQGATSTQNDGLQLESATNWTNSGTVTAAGSLVLGDALGHVSTVTNSSTGVYDLSSDTGLSLGSSFHTASSFINNGMFEKTGGSGTSMVDTLFVNNGTISVTQGTLEFAAGMLSGSGTIVGTKTTDGSGNIFITA